MVTNILGRFATKKNVAILFSGKQGMRCLICIYLFILALLGLCCCSGFSGCGEWGLLELQCSLSLCGWKLLVSEHGFRGAWVLVVAP